MNSENITNHELRLKSAGVNFSIMTGSDVITKEIQKNIEEFSSLKQGDINKIFFIVSYTLLFNAQKILWESGQIKKENDALVFEKYLFQMFEKATGYDPLPFIKDLVNYVNKDDKEDEKRRRQIQYIGSRLCREFGKEDAILMLKIVTVFSALLPPFYKSVKGVWDLPDTALEKMLEVVEK